MASEVRPARYDLFVSYARADPDLIGIDGDWVQQLVATLRNLFQQRTGRALNVFIDTAGVVNQAAVAEAIQQSLAMLIVATPRYFETTSAMFEAGQFRAGALRRNNIFIVEAMPTGNYPAALNNLPCTPFWHTGETGPEPLGPGNPDFYQPAAQLAGRIADVLNATETSDEPDSSGSRNLEAEPRGPVEAPSDAPPASLVSENQSEGAEPDEPAPDQLTGVWIFYATEPESNRGWMDALVPGDTIFWRHGTVSGGGSYRRQIRRGDSVIILVGRAFIASGILLADEELRFVDDRGRVRRPVRIIERYSTPIDRGELEGRWGKKLVNQGAVHPVPEPLLEIFNGTITTTYVQSTYGGPLPLPFSYELIDSELARQSLLTDLANSPGILPNLETAAKLGWEGEVWSMSFEPQAEAAEEVSVVEQPPPARPPANASRPDMDARIPFVLDAPADSEDQLDRGPFALFLAQRLHLIWCQMNGHAPAPGGGRTAASGPDADTFIAHVDSPWGGGKTTFANFVARVLDPGGQKLTARHFLRSSLAATVPDDQLEGIALDEVFMPPYARDGAANWPGARRPWIIARYNAWRDQYVQPPWWQVFLTIEDAVTQEMRREAWAGCREGWRTRRAGPIGRAASLYVRSLGVTSTRFRYQIWNRKLKAQVILLGAAVALVASAWALGLFDGLSGASNEPKKLSEWLALGTAVIGIGGASVAAVFTAISQSLSPDLDFTAEHKQIGVQDPISRFRRTFRRILAATDRPVLLIVDDLDRCEPRAVVELLRGFQTIIRSPRLFVLLLGDRAWIENAHDVHHKDLAGMREGEGGLGARFVQKVIQLSFRLPTINGDARARFARRVLGDEDPVEKANIAEVLRQVDNQVATIMDQGGSVGSKEAEVAKVIDEARTEFSKGLSDEQVEEATNLAEQIANVKLVAAAGADTAQQRSVFNAITQLVGSLPNNPRQIKRIFMAFATYEVVGRVYFGYQLTAEGTDGERKSRRWRQLAMWVTLAIEWPETWRALARRPDILRAAYGEEADRNATEAALLDALPEDERKAAKAVVERLRRDRSLRALLTAAAGSVPEEREFGDTWMEPEAIYEFNRIIWEPGFLIESPLA